MSAKHFRQIAATLARQHKNISDDAFKALVSDIANVCDSANPNFQRQRFIDACYVNVV